MIFFLHKIEILPIRALPFIWEAFLLVISFTPPRESVLTSTLLKFNRLANLIPSSTPHNSAI
jgi:hypothetical protein